MLPLVTNIPGIFEAILTHLHPEDVRNLRLVNKEAKEVVDHILHTLTPRYIARAQTPALYKFLATHWNVKEVISDKDEPVILDPVARDSDTSDSDSTFSDVTGCSCYKWIGVMDDIAHKFGLEREDDVKQVSRSNDCELGFFKKPEDNGKYILYASSKDKVIITLPSEKKYCIIEASEPDPKYVLIVEGDRPWWKSTSQSVFKLHVVNMTRSNDEAVITKTVGLVLPGPSKHPNYYVSNYQNKLLFIFDERADEGKIYMLDDKEEECEGPVREFSGLDNDIVKAFDVFEWLRFDRRRLDSDSSSESFGITDGDDWSWDSEASSESNLNTDSMETDTNGSDSVSVGEYETTSESDSVMESDSTTGSGGTLAPGSNSESESDNSPNL